MHVSELNERLNLVLYMNLGGIEVPECYKMIPEGWHSLVKMAVRLTDLMDNCIVEIGIRQGLFVVKFKGTNELDNEICELFRNAVAQKSSVTCMICSKRGFRRKREALVPTLCGPHYVEYINYLDDNGL
jgi:hypothetical protein